MYKLLYLYMKSEYMIYLIVSLNWVIVILQCIPFLFHQLSLDEMAL